MVGLRKEQLFNTLEKLYVKKGMQYDMEKIRNLSILQLRKEITRLREYRA